MERNSAAQMRTDAEEKAEKSAEVADGIRSVIDVTMYRDSDFNLDPHRFKIECAGVELAKLHDGEWLTAHHVYQVEAVWAEDHATGVVARVRHRRE